MLPDLFGYWLTGQLATEQTIASTSQLLDVATRTWAVDVIDKLGIPRRLFDFEVVPAGTRGGSAARPSRGSTVDGRRARHRLGRRRGAGRGADVRLHLRRVRGRWSGWS